MSRDWVAGQRLEAFVDTLLQDLRYSFRTLVKRSRILTVVVMLTLGLGIGTNTAIFSVMNAFFLRPLPVKNANQLVYLAARHEGSSDYIPFSYLDYEDLRGQTVESSDLLAYEVSLVGLSTGGRPTQIAVSYVDKDFFPLLGLKPAVGQLIFGDDSERPGAAPVVVLGYSFWKNKLGGDPGIIGHPVKLNGQIATVIGVAPEGFHGLYSVAEMQAYLPLGMAIIENDGKDIFSRRDHRVLTVLGVKKPDLSLRQAQSSIDLVVQRLAQQYPEADKGLSVQLFPERLARPQPIPGNSLVIVSALFLVLAGLVLLLACTNVANILLVRASARRREMGLRIALGANRSRLIRQLLTESVVLSSLGAVAGLVFGNLASRLLGSINIAAAGVPFRLDFSFDWRVFGFALLLALVTGVVIGMAPAFRSSRADACEVLHEGSRGTSESGTRSWFRNSLVVLQVAGSFMLLVVAGLFIRSVQNGERMDWGFDPNHVINFGMDTHFVGLDKAQSQEFYRNLKDRVRALPGVQMVGETSNTPLGYFTNQDPLYAEGRPISSKEATPEISYDLVDPGYFETLHIPILRGRGFLETDKEGSPLVAVVNEAMANRFWPNEDPLGKRFSKSGVSGPFIQIVGITKNGKYLNPLDRDRAFYYLPQDQNPTTMRVLQVKTRIAPERMIADTEKQIHALNPDLPVFGVETMEQSLGGGNGMFLFTMGAKLTTALGMTGLILAVVGLYGVISYLSNLRTREIGIRMAIGANRMSILRMVMRHGVWLVITGIALGLLLTIVITNAISDLLLGVKASDPLTFSVVTLLLMAVGLAATLIPGWRASRLQPMNALKYE